MIAKIWGTLYWLPETASERLQRKLSTNCVIETLAGANYIATDHLQSGIISLKSRASNRIVECSNYICIWFVYMHKIAMCCKFSI